jgi:hypothetical protein
MAYTSAEARRELLEALEAAIDRLGLALAALGEAYDQLDERSADRLEEQLFGPVQLAYGRAKRAHARFADQHGLPVRSFAQQPAGIPSTGARGFIDAAVDAAAAADAELADLQDGGLPSEVGDVELRAALANVRELLDGTSRRARELGRVLGR